MKLNCYQLLKTVSPVSYRKSYLKRTAVRGLRVKVVRACVSYRSPARRVFARFFAKKSFFFSSPALLFSILRTLYPLVYGQSRSDLW